jgi:cardiolipin synthase
VNLPNILTLGRIVTVPIVVWLISVERFQAAFWCFVAAGITDGIDGYLARRLNQRTTLGAYLDPLADKALLVSIYVSLGIVGHLPSWLVILVVSRDLMIVGAVILSWLLERPVAIKPLLVSKANTVGQIVLAALVLCDLGFPVDLSMLVWIALWTTAALTLVSAAAYLMHWVRHMTNGDDAAAPGG